MNMLKNVKKKICVVGGDRRQLYLSQLLADRGHVVTCYATVSGKETTPEALRHREQEAQTSESANERKGYGAESPNLQSEGAYAESGAYADSQNECMEQAIRGCDTVILPFPLSPDGITLNCTSADKPRLEDLFCAVRRLCLPSVKVFGGAVKRVSAEIAEKHGIAVTDYGMIEDIAVRNAVPTAEGALEVAMKELDVTVRGSCAAVIGYGRCGSELARLLKALGAEVVGIARSGRDRAKMSKDGVRGYGFERLSEALCEADIIFNTVPFHVIDCQTLAELPRGSVIVELASAPGGVDRECAAEYGVKVIHAPSLPGKYAPKTAAEIIGEALIPIIERND